MGDVSPLNFNLSNVTYFKILFLEIIPISFLLPLPLSYPSHEPPFLSQFYCLFSLNAHINKTINKTCLFLITLSVCICVQAWPVVLDNQLGDSSLGRTISSDLGDPSLGRTISSDLSLPQLPIDFFLSSLRPNKLFPFHISIPIGFVII